MTELDRRVLMGGLLTASALAAGAARGAARQIDPKTVKKEAEIACVYHCDFGDHTRFNQMITNISNHYSVYGNPLDIQIAVVAHGQGVKFFLEDLSSSPWKEESAVAKMFDRVADVAKNGLTVYLCEITFQRLELDKAKVHNADFLGFVPSGVAAVAELQSKGFGYIKIG